MTAGALIFLGFAIIAASFILVSVKILQVRPDFVKKVLKYALIFIFAIVFSIIAATIGFRIDDRHSRSYSANLKSVQEIWGGNITQRLPELTYKVRGFAEYENKKTGEIEKIPADIEKNMGIADQKISALIKSNIRQKGLLKYPGYSLSFHGRYLIKNLNNTNENLFFKFRLPEGAGNITDLKVLFEGKAYTADPDFSDGIEWRGSLRNGETKKIEISYNAQGTGLFDYAMGNRKSEIKNLEVEIVTDFAECDIPNGAMIPASQGGDNEMTKYTWKASNIVTGQNISLKFTIPGNYGELVSKLFYYAPIAIFLFTGFILIFCTAGGIALHPMHYLFMITGYFIFYLLGSYMVSYIPIITAVAVSLAVSTGIVVYYAYLIKKGSELVLITLYSSVLFQWVFSIAFFIPEHTGFIITIASIVAFVFLMKRTAAIDWENKW
ncbi:MAG TPA: hypothetical protein P5120_04090 [Spirochaetota bacterium]|nr:hypothetical protein [Spirochaetota bacterium]HPF06149.1 hypothetical protein [Spirochaetota bacterium]HPJ41313.1 hypothetical protein [Spirochaetota bacterium]HPR37047.1 hypothetical protein [Spirochaetota bacterium]HRX46678.1 hypothetical protein [Spirochaetota bacterium]